MQNFYVWTIGCQMNRADSERLESALAHMGLGSAPSPGDADVIVLNTCVVRQSAEERAVGMLTSLKPLKARRPEKVLALMGCMVGPRVDDLRRRYPYVDVFMAPQDYAPLVALVGERLGVDAACRVGEPTAAPAVATFVPISRGCDKFCSFCIIPYRRGREVSRPLGEIVRETERLAARGVKDVTFLGQNVDSYGRDLPGALDLADLLAAANDIAGLERIRFLTSHPSDMSDAIIDAVAGLPKVCEHFNLPFQAGSDAVLKGMRRDYTSARYRALLERIRERVPNVSLSTDLIVGFCGETREEFRETVGMLRDIRFDKVHAAAYSHRPGTIAARRLEDDVPPEEKAARLAEVQALQETILAEKNARLLGATVEVLVEGRKKGRAYGRTRGDKLVHFDGGGECAGTLTRVVVRETRPWYLVGAIAPVVAQTGSAQD